MLPEEQARFAVLEEKVERLETQNQALYDIAGSVKLIAQEQGYISKKVDKLDCKVDLLEKAPARRWESVVDKIFAALVGGVIAYFITQITSL